LQSEIKNVSTTSKKQHKSIVKTLEKQQESLVTKAGTAVVVREAVKAAYDQTIGTTATFKKLGKTVQKGALAQIVSSLEKAKDSTKGPTIVQEITTLAQMIKQSSNPDKASKFASLSSISHASPNQSQK
jgi:hypothetical protein